VAQRRRLGCGRGRPGRRLGLCFAFHGLIERALRTGAIEGEIAAVREAHSILIDQVERLDAQLEQ
jgi:cyclic-di-GMP phosphodiesterase TipF (flagellum assembly factor)